MSDDQVAVILTKDVRDTRLDTEYLLVIGTEDGPGGLGMSVAAGVSTFNTPGVEAAFEGTERTYDPAAYDDGTIVARIHPDGTTEWPLESNE